MPFNVGFIAKIHFKPLMHSLSSFIGFIHGFCNFIWSSLKAHCEKKYRFCMNNRLEFVHDDFYLLIYWFSVARWSFFWSVLSFVWCKNRKLECQRVVVRGTKTSNYHLPYSRHNATYQRHTLRKIMRNLFKKLRILY